MLYYSSLILFYYFIHQENVKLNTVLSIVSLATSNTRTTLLRHALICNQKILDIYDEEKHCFERRIIKKDFNVKHSAVFHICKF